MPPPVGPGSYLGPSPDGVLLGRSDLLDQLAATATDALGGAGSVVLLAGEAGIGKTSVVRSFARQDHGFAVSWGKCAAHRSAPPFWPWRALVEPDPSTAGIGRNDPADRAIGAERFERLKDLGDQVLARAATAPVLHIIEDLQWADVASVLLTAHLGATISRTPLLVVATLRTGEPLTRPLADAIEEIRQSALVRHLQPLDPVDVAALMRRSGIEPDPALTEVIHVRTGGNPLFVTELLRMLDTGAEEQRHQQAAESVPARVAELVAHRLAHLPTAVVDGLETAAALGSEGDTRTLAAAYGAPIEAVLDLLEQARAAHLLDATEPGRWAFRHELVRDAVYTSLTATRRADRHTAAFQALAADGATPVPVLAHHALAAQPLFDADRAVALAAEAGRSALAEHAYEEAAVWFEHALATAPAETGPRWRAELLVLSGEAHRSAGALPAARQAFVQAAEMAADPALMARAALGHADPGADLGIAYRTEDPATVELLDRAISLQPTADSPTMVLLESRLAAELYFSDEPGRAQQLVTAAIDRATRLNDPRSLAVATAVAHDAFVVGQRPLDDQLRESAQLLEWANETGTAGALLTAHRARVFDLVAAGDMAAVDTEVLAFRRIAEPLRAPGYRWWLSLWSAMRALLEGRHDDAETSALAAYRLGEGSFPLLAFLNLSFLLFFLRREQGRLDEMEQATRELAAENADVPAIRVALMFLLAETGRLDEARGMLSGVDDHLLARLRDRNWPATWFQLARSAAIVADRHLAATLLDDRHRPSERCIPVSLATVCLGASDLATAWLLHTVGDLDAADARYAAAAALSSRVGARSWLAQTRADHARLLLDRGSDGDRAEADRLARLAAAAAEEIGLVSVRPAIEELEHRLGRPSEGGTDRPATTTAGIFRRAGPVWEIEFGGRAAAVTHTRGLSDLARLLERPGEAVSVVELLDLPGPAHTGDRGATVFDERARREIRDRLRELDAEEAEADADGDGERAARARERRQELAEAVARDLGLGGRSRRVGDEVERARKTVSTRIRRGIAHVGRSHPELGRHLERSIDTGAWCAYRPAEPTTWTT